MIRDGLESRNLSFNLLAPESWKSASGLVVSQTDYIDSEGSWESKYMLKQIGTGILEVCEWSDSVADETTLSTREGLWGRHLSFIYLAPVSWKSASGLVVSQTDAFDSGGSLESKYMLKLIGTGILEICEWSDSVADRRFRLRRVLGVEI